MSIRFAFPSNVVWFPYVFDGGVGENRTPDNHNAIVSIVLLDCWGQEQFKRAFRAFLRSDRTAAHLKVVGQPNDEVGVKRILKDARHSNAGDFACPL